MTVYEIYKDYPNLDFAEVSKTQEYDIGSRMERVRIIQMLQGWGYIRPDLFDRDAQFLEAIKGDKE
jgi:hypothetical protein